MSENFDPKSKLTKMQGKDYLEVKWRIAWFRADHPKGSIITEIINEGVIKATVLDGDNRLLATGHGTPKMQGVAKSRPYEGAETAAIGRALAHAGYGTQFADELDEGEHLADAPVENSAEKKEAEKRQIAMNMYSELIKRGKAVKLQMPAMDAGWDSAKMKAHYNEQLGFVKQAEEQAKAGQ